jgi:hypothetical protein
MENSQADTEQSDEDKRQERPVLGSGKTLSDRMAVLLGNPEQELLLTVSAETRAVAVFCHSPRKLFK